MTLEYSSPAAPYLRKTSRILNAVIFIIGFFVLIGWATRTETLKRLIPDSVAVNPLSAICFLLCAVSLWIQQNEKAEVKKIKAARRIALTVALIGFAKFMFVVLGFDFYLDTVLFSGQLLDPVRNDLNRMAPNSAVCFFLAGLSLFYFDKEIFHERRPAQYFSIIIMFIAILSLYGYVYGVKFLYGIAHYIPMSVITAFNFLFLSLAMLFARPEKGSMAIVIGDTSAEVTLLRLAAFIIPLLMGWLKLKGEKMGYYNTEFGTALFAIVTYALALFLLGRRSVVNYRMRMVKKLAADELKKAHDRFFQFFHMSPEVKTISGLEDGRMLYVNKAYEDFFGIKAKDAIGRTSLELKTITPEQRLELTNKIKESGMTRGIETQFKNSLGEIRDVFIDTEIIELDDQKCILSNVHDITSRKRTEEALQQKEQLLRSIVDNIGEGLIVVDTEGKYLVVNPVAEKIIRQRPTDVNVAEVSKKFGLFYPDQVTPLPTSETTVSRSLHGLDTDELEMFIRNPNIPDGKFLVATGRPIRDAEGKVIAAVSVFRDDTRRKQLQLLLNESEQKLKEVVRTVGEGIVMCNTHGQFILFNRKAEEIVGLGALDVPPEQWPEKYHIYYPDGSRLFKVDELLLMRALHGETMEHIEIMIRNKEAGIEKNLLVSARPVRAGNGEIIAAIADFKDISEVKRLEHLLSEIKDKYNQLIDRNR